MKKDTTSQKGLILENELSEIPSFEELNKDVNAFMNKWGLVGASVAIVKDGRLVYSKGFGYADKEKKEKVTPGHIFRVASISKLITAVAVMKLIEEGQLTLDSYVFGKKGILNDDKYSKATDKRFYKITVKHLLIHEGGWHSQYGDQMFMPHYIAGYMGKKLPIDAETIIQFALKKGLHFEPGTAISYSNLGYCILGKVIEKVTGVEYEEYVKTRLMEKLDIHGMQMTRNRLEEKAWNEVKYYDISGSNNRLSIYGTGKYEPKTYEGTDYETLGPAGGWAASSAQLMRFMVAIDGFSIKEDIITCETIDSMTCLPKPEKFGIGWVHADENDNWWRTGTLCGTSAFMMRRSDGISYAFITNTGTSKGAKFAYEIRNMMQDALSKVNWWPSHDLFELLKDTQIPDRYELK